MHAGDERDMLFLRILWETGVRVAEAIRIQLAGLSRVGIRVLEKGSVERVVFVQPSLVTAILVYAQEDRLQRDDYLCLRVGAAASPNSELIRSLKKLPLGAAYSGTCMPISFATATPSTS